MSSVDVRGEDPAATEMIFSDYGDGMTSRNGNFHRLPILVVLSEVVKCPIEFGAAEVNTMADLAATEASHAIARFDRH